jgi:hypothetical protein
MTKDELVHSNVVGAVLRAPDGQPIYALYDANTGTLIASTLAEWYNPFRSVSLVHKHIESTLRSLDALSGVMIAAGHEDFAQTVDIIAAGLLQGQRVALVGIEAQIDHGERKD